MVLNLPHEKNQPSNPRLFTQSLKATKIILSKYLNAIDKRKYNANNFDLFSGESSVYSLQIEVSTVTENDLIEFVSTSDHS